MNYNLLLLVAFVAAVLLHLLFIKKTKLLICLVSLYAGFALMIILPMFSARILDWLQSYPYSRAASFAVLVAILYFILSLSNLEEFSRDIAPSQFVTSLAYRIVLVGLFFAVGLCLLPASIKSGFGAPVKILFLNLPAIAVWFLLPLALAFVYRFKTRRGWAE